MLMRRVALAGLIAFAASTSHAQTTNRAGPDGASAVELERPAVFELSPRTGSLKETVQKGQELIWRRKEGERERQFRVDNISVALLRVAPGALPPALPVGVRLDQLGPVEDYPVEGGRMVRYRASLGDYVGHYLFGWTADDSIFWAA